MEDLQAVEHVCRKDPKVIEQCMISGIPAEDMHKVYCDRKQSLFLIHLLHTYILKHGQLVTMKDSAVMFAFNKL